MRTFIVESVKHDKMKVMAAEFRIEHGALVLYRRQVGNALVAFRSFAPGVWAEIYEGE